VAPASRSSCTIRPDVVPRTIESSTSTTRLPTTASVAASFSFTFCSRRCGLGAMKLRPA
jgi:hypothetical protein